MTENKRFILVDIGFVRDNGKIVGMKDIVAIMNELYEENEEIGNTLDNMVTFKNKYKDRYRKLKEENEQLKSEINMLKTTIGRNEGYIDRLTHKGEWR